jgi:hypothetical protein
MGVEMGANGSKNATPSGGAGATASTISSSGPNVENPPVGPNEVVVQDGGRHRKSHRSSQKVHKKGRKSHHKGRTHRRSKSRRQQ